MSDGSAPLAPALDLVKSIADLLHLKPDQPEKPQARSGPLVVVGRFYISLTLILAVSASAAAYLDTKLPDGHHTSPAVEALRVTVLVCAVLGLVSSLVFILFLAASKPLLIFSPTELSAEAQQSLYAPRMKDQDMKTTAAPTPEPKASEEAEARPPAETKAPGPAEAKAPEVNTSVPSGAGETG